MAPKKQKAEEDQPDIRDSFDYKMNPGKVKEDKTEEAGTSKADHLHTFTVKFGADGREYTIACTQPDGVLQVIKSHDFKEKIKGPDEKIVIKLGEGIDGPIVATHFPCSCVDEGECLTITTSTNKVEKKQKEPSVLPKDNYSVFFIDKVGGENTKTKPAKLFRCNNIPGKFRFYCVYAEKGMKIKEALRLDGRFVDDLSDFSLSCNKSGKFTRCTEIVDCLHEKKFQICLEKKKNPDVQQPIQKQDATQHQSTSVDSQNKNKTTSVLEYAKSNSVSLQTAIKETGSEVDLKEIKKLLQQQFPKLKNWMEERFPGRSFRKALELKKEKFGKIQQSFSEVRTIRELVRLSESVCLLELKENNSAVTVQGSGFLLFDNFVLTSAHLFDRWQTIAIGNWGDYFTITATFNSEKQDGSERPWQAKGVLWNNDLDYALLELTCESPTPGPTETVPPGLLERFGPVPEPNDDGGACIIGHPGGGVKKMDLTCVIRKENMEQAVEQNLQSYRDYIFTLCSVKYQIKRHRYADIHVTYNSFMYHGASGSPVFDAFGRVFGLHTGGFYFEEFIPGHSVIEYAFPLLKVFENLLDQMRNNGREDLLERVKEVAKGNIHLETILDRKLNQNKDQIHCEENQEERMETGKPESE
ncbi:protein FAM111A-like isoform X2 [Fundulus heteroclitus]|uniref:protein FAM111A-like isoform X2 n=1 Tax=Fundulus heteroclitus TaxID=8078 RepID=UPI00165A6139|nr:protein FAM111A-like isoform X2 [Fundulus heteroclitus]